MRWLIVVALVVACSKNQDPPPPSSGVPNGQQESGPRRKAPAGGGDVAQKMYATVCANCHGATGAGDGMMAKSLPIKPRNYTDAAWQASISDADIRKTILLGGAGVGKSPM